MARVVGRTASVLDGLPGALQSLARAIDQMRLDLIRDSGLPLTELRALTRISEIPGINPRALANLLELGPPAVTALTDSLVERGLVVRIPDPADRRRIILLMTSQGDRSMERSFRTYLDFVKSASAHLDAGEADALATSINDLIAGLEKAHLAKVAELADAAQAGQVGQVGQAEAPGK